MTYSELHPAAQPVEQLLAQCTVRRGRRSGPGGQHRNKVETAVVIVHETTGVTGEAAERRSQPQNHRMAVHRLRTNLALQIRRAVEPRATPSPLWQSRCQSGRLAIAESHTDFPSILAEALDVVAEHQFNVRQAAHQLGCSTTQLVKLLKLQPRALQLVNQHRTELSLPPLR